MNIKDFMSEGLININLQARSKKELIDELSLLFQKNNKISDLEGFRKDLLARESISSTALEEGIAVPHCKSKYVKEISIAFGLHKEGIDYDSLDGEVSKLFFMIAAPEGTADAHVDCLAELTKYLLDDNFRNKLLNVKNPSDILQLIEKGIEEEVKNKKSDEFFVAVTACPTGIAHTYMSAEALSKGAKDLGVEIKVETNGSAGVKNPLTSEDIERAEGVIIAADKNVEMDRFNGKRLVITGTKAAIKNPKELINQSKTAKVYTSSKKTGVSVSNERTGFYKHLMNGVSNMLPFVVGGGILIALSFIFGIEAFNPEHPSFHPVAKFLMDVGGGGAFGLMVPILAGFIGLSIADRPGFMPAMVAGIMANSSDGGFLGGLIGGFLAGGLAMLFACELPAPHGGLFVIPLVKNALMYIVAISAGSLVGAVLLGTLKKDRVNL